MKNTHIDPILAKVHAIKDAISAEFNHDVTALCHHLQERERASARLSSPPGKILRPAQAKRRRRTKVVA